MASNVSVTVIGRTTRVRGRLNGASDLEVQGFVEGDIGVGGDVTIDAQGMVGGSVSGRRLVVRGAVKGDLSGDEAVLLEDGARVVGDIRAPRVSIAQGALVRGHVTTGGADGAPERASRTQGAARPASKAAHAPPVAALSPPVAPPTPAAKPAAPAPAQAAPAIRRPPPPVVPALKKAKGQIAKKKER
jgi:cytoskeletal protein CcmA (bactofilin family)